MWRSLPPGQKLERNTAGEPQLTPVITLLVSPDDAQKLTLASTQGKIQLALRNPLDTKQQELAAVGTGALYRGVPVAAVTTAAPKPKSTKHNVVLTPTAPPPYSVEVIKGTKKENITPSSRTSQHSEEEDHVDPLPHVGETRNWNRN